MSAAKRQEALENLAHRLRKDGHITYDEALTIYSAAAREWDDAIHVAAPWDKRVSLCGNWERNLVPLDGPRPDGWGGCWTCLLTADWLDAHVVDADPVKPEPPRARVRLPWMPRGRRR